MIKKKCTEHAQIHKSIFENRMNIDRECITLLKGKSIMCKYGRTDCAMATIGEINKNYELKRVMIKWERSIFKRGEEICWSRVDCVAPKRIKHPPKLYGFTTT